nr:hypothetical protein [uncultured Marvinbryantia sp.]
MEIERALAMAVAVVAEETGVDAKKVTVVSFKEVQKSSLEKYIENNQIIYHKYQLEDSRV